MVKFALKLLLFAGIFLIYDKLFIILTRLSPSLEVDKRLELVLKGEINKDVIIVGSSRGARGIIASQIEDKTGYSTYNLCYPGSNVVFHNFMLKSLLEFNERPKFVFMVVDDDTELKRSNIIIYRKDRLYPLVKYRYIWKELANYDGREVLFSSFLVLDRINKYNFDLKRKKFNPYDTIISCGSMPLSWQDKARDWNIDFGQRVYSREKETDEYINAYKEIIKICSQKNITLIITFPPILKTHSRTFEERIRELGDQKTNYYIYNTNNPVYMKEEYFHDVGHLRRPAAEVFTDELIQYLNKLTGINQN